MKSACVRCGTMADCEYGTDGMPYCQSCIFYGLNQQCWHCRMYLPSSELQQYKGQWMCPYCVQDMRYRDMEQEREATKPEAPIVRKHTVEETCERCGDKLGDIVHIWNGRRLCDRCLRGEQDKWSLLGGGPSSSSYAIDIEASADKKRPLLDKLVSNFLSYLHLKRRPPRRVVVYETKMHAEHAKPLSETAMQAGPPQRPPKSEGLIKPAIRSSARSSALHPTAPEGSIRPLAKTGTAPAIRSADIHIDPADKRTTGRTKAEPMKHGTLPSRTGPADKATDSANPRARSAIPDRIGSIEDPLSGVVKPHPKRKTDKKSAKRPKKE